MKKGIIINLSNYITYNSFIINLNYSNNKFVSYSKSVERNIFKYKFMNYVNNM